MYGFKCALFSGDSGESIEAVKKVFLLPFKTVRRPGLPCLIADQFLIMDTAFHAIGEQETKSASVIMERGTWIGARAITLQAVTISVGAMVRAGAVVARPVPPRAIAVGNPAPAVRAY